MFNCPYCQRCFTTKQRLISHLSRINKCYDVEVVGVPPILLELMGFNEIVKDDINITHSKSESKSENESEDENESENSRVTSHLLHKCICDKCLRIFENEKNLDKHKTSGKCEPNNLKYNIDDKIPIIFKSKEENKNMTRIVKKPVIKNENSCQSNIKYIVKDNYLDCLTDLIGSKEDALKYIRACIQSKIRGGVNLLYKIYFEGRKYNDYPIEIVDSKGKKMYYKTPNSVILDENAVYVKSVLINNLRNCYLQFCNHVISTNLDDNDIIFNEYDLAEMQKHILELSDEKKKDKIILGLIDQIHK